MLIKSMDCRDEEIAQLERVAASLSGDAGKRVTDELKRRKAGLKGEQDAAYLIDFHFERSKNNAVVHDLRIEHGNRVAQIDHLIITRSMECYVLESKHFHAGIKITEDGEFLRWDNFGKTYVGMESPLEQNERHIAVLKDVTHTLDLPVRLGMRISPTFRSFVLVSSISRIDRPKNFDTSRVIKADQIKKRFLDDIDRESTLSTLVSAARFVSRETMQGVAEQLVALHRPMKWPMPDRLVPSVERPPVKVSLGRVADAPEPQQSSERRPSCKKCGGSSGGIQHGKYGYYFKCATCDGNTAIRFECQAGHKPKLRKSGNEFYRDCGECGTSRQYFVNRSS